jgi:AbrB family looped-hinge helix DNA binding protein
MSDMIKKSQRQLVRVGKRGTLVIPAEVRAVLGIEEGQVLELSVSDGGLVLEPVPESPVERFRNAVGPFFEGVDPVEFQRELRTEAP